MSTEITLTGEKLQADQAAVEAYLKHVQKRRSIRKLASGPVSDETMRTILEAGRWSPSSALPHQNLPLSVPPSLFSPFLPLILLRGLKRICDPWPNKPSGTILGNKRKRVVRQSKGDLSHTLSGCLTDRRNT
jgi:nitroreductase